MIIDLEEVVRRIHPELPDVSCYVAQTGGGCATIYLGSRYHFMAGDPVSHVGDAWWQSENGDYVPVLAGPGWFEGPGWTEGRADASDFSIGYDQDFPDVSIDGWDVDTAEERVIARRMVQLYRDHPVVRKGFLL